MSLPTKTDTLTAKNIISAYRSAYNAVHNKFPDECVHLVGRWFIVDGVVRDRAWLLVEIETLRQQALQQDPPPDDEQRTFLHKLLKKIHERRQQAVDDTMNIPHAAMEGLRPPPAAGSDEFPENGRLVLKIKDETIRVPLRSKVGFGREVPKLGKTLFIDLVPFEGLKDGISRRHAEIALTKEGKVTITDLASSNGTFVNGTHLLPLKTYPLHNGDELRLGRMTIVVNFDEAPTEEEAASAEDDGKPTSQLTRD